MQTLDIVICHDENRLVKHYGKLALNEGQLTVHEPSTLDVEYITDFASDWELFEDVSGVPEDIRANKYYYNEDGSFTLNLDWSGFTGTEQAFEMKRRDIMDYREGFMKGGFTYGGVDFMSRPQDRENFIGVMIVAMVINSQNPDSEQTFPWTLRDDRVALLTVDEVIQIGLTFFDFLNNCFVAARYHIGQIREMEERRAIEKYEFRNIMWPNRDLGGTLENEPIIM